MPPAPAPPHPARIEPAPPHRHLVAHRARVRDRADHDPDRLGQPPAARQRPVPEGERAARPGSADPQRAVGLPRQPALQQRRCLRASSKSSCPTAIKPLAGPVAAGLREPAVTAVNFLLGQPRVQQAFVNATGIAHQKLVNVLENKTGYGIDTGNGVVTVDLSALVKELGTDLGLPAAALAKIPAGTGVITVMKSDQLSRGAARRAADQGAERLAHRPRARPVRHRHLSRPRAPAIDAAEHRLGLRPRRPDRAGRPSRHRQLRGQRARSAGEPAGGPPHLADREHDPRRHRPGRRLLRARDRARRDPRRPAHLRHLASGTGWRPRWPPVPA